MLDWRALGSGGARSKQILMSGNELPTLVSLTLARGEVPMATVIFFPRLDERSFWLKRAGVPIE